jgi:hypothetical protein
MISSEWHQKLQANLQTKAPLSPTVESGYLWESDVETHPQPPSSWAGPLGDDLDLDKM